MSGNELLKCVEMWIDDWNDHNLPAVMALFHQEAEFISWTGQCFKGKRTIQRAWTNWFKNHGDFHFSIERLTLDELQHIVSMEWTLVWPSPEAGYENRQETRRGVDIIQFKNGLILSKKSFWQAVLLIDAEAVCLHL